MKGNLIPCLYSTTTHDSSALKSFLPCGHSPGAQLEMHIQMHRWKWLLNTGLCTSQKEGGIYYLRKFTFWSGTQSKRIRECLVRLQWWHFDSGRFLWSVHESCIIASLESSFRHGMQICTHGDCKWSHWAERVLQHTTENFRQWIEWHTFHPWLKMLHIIVSKVRTDLFSLQVW